MSQAKRKTTILPIKTADEALFKLHSNFVRAYAGALSLDAGANTPVNGATKKEKELERKWDRAVDEAYKKARAVLEAPAFTLEGMLMKIHIAGFCFDWRKKDSFSAPYHGMICSDGKPQQWEMRDDLGHPLDEKIVLILSLRTDLQRFAGKQT